MAAPSLGPDGLSVIALPYLVLLKVQASRGIDIGDLTCILGAAGEADLESLIQLGRLEYVGTCRSEA